MTKSEIITELKKIAESIEYTGANNIHAINGLIRKAEGSSIKKSTVETTDIVVILDDVSLTVDNKKNGQTIFRSVYHVQFSKLIEILLSKSQLKEYIERDTARTFRVSAKKIEAGKEYMADNI